MTGIAAITVCWESTAQAARHDRRWTMLIPLPRRPLLGTAIVLRRWEEDDAEWYVRARDEEIFRWTKELRTLTPEHVRNAITRYLSHPTYAGFAITDASSGSLLGNISLVITESERSAEVMYWLAESARGRGVATEAVCSLVRWAFETLPIERIELFTHVDNKASQRVAERADFVPGGLVVGGKHGEQLIFTMTRQRRGTSA